MLDPVQLARFLSLNPTHQAAFMEATRLQAPDSATRIPPVVGPLSVLRVVLRRLPSDETTRSILEALVDAAECSPEAGLSSMVTSGLVGDDADVLRVRLLTEVMPRLHSLSGDDVERITMWSRTRATVDQPARGDRQR